MNYKEIKPIKATISSESNCTRLHVSIVGDNLIDSCTLHYFLMNDSGESQLSGNVEILGEDYENWDGNNDFPYKHVAQELGLTLI